MSAEIPTPRPRDARANALRRAAFDAERVAVAREALAVVHTENVDLAHIARSIADAAWNHLWLYLDGLGRSRGRDCRAYLADREGTSVAECAQIGRHTAHVGLDPDGRFVSWDDQAEGARRG